MTDSDVQRQKEEISRQQFWYATTTLAFIGFVASVVRPANALEFGIFAPMLLLSMCAGIYMVVVCHKEYLSRDGRRMRWWRAFGHSLRERRAALFCIVLILIEGISLILILLSRIGWIGRSH